MTNIWLLTGVGITALIAASIALYWIPKYQVRHVSNVATRWKNENEARRTLAQIFGGIALFGGLTFTWIQIHDTEQHNRESEATENLKRRGEQFARGIDKIADQHHVEVRIGGIYSLGQLAHESRDDYWPIMELLAAYVRSRAHRSAESALTSDNPDIQAAIRIIAWRDAGCDPDVHAHLDLSETTLREIDFGDANLAHVELDGADLEGAIFGGADLRGATLGERNHVTTNLRGVVFRSADLRGVHFPEDATFVKRGVDELGDVTNANVHGVTPPEVFKQLIRAGALDIADDAEWKQKRDEVEGETGSDQPRVFSGVPGCRGL